MRTLRAELEADPGATTARERQARVAQARAPLPALEAKKKPGERPKARASTTDPVPSARSPATPPEGYQGCEAFACHRLDTQEHARRRIRRDIFSPFLPAGRRPRCWAGLILLATSETGRQGPWLPAVRRALLSCRDVIHPQDHEREGDANEEAHGRSPPRLPDA